VAGRKEVESSFSGFRKALDNVRFSCVNRQSKKANIKGSWVQKGIDSAGVKITNNTMDIPYFINLYDNNKKLWGYLQ
jgi:hypothetical protein